MKRKLLFIAMLLSLVTLSSCTNFGLKKGKPEIEKKSFVYAPWVDLSRYFDLDKIQVSESGLKSFNSLDISYGKQLFAGQRHDNSVYNATVLGTGVRLRSQPTIEKSSIRSSLNTGDKLSVLRSIGYMNGKYWDYVYVNTGCSMGREGYVCSDFIVSQEQAEIIHGYIFRDGSNINVSTPSKMLRAIADILLAFEVNLRHPNIGVQMLNDINYGEHNIVTYQIRDYSIAENNTMLAVVQFFSTNNDFVVLGIVPGNNVNNVVRNPNGSYDIHFN